MLFQRFKVSIGEYDVQGLHPLAILEPAGMYSFHNLYRNLTVKSWEKPQATFLFPELARSLC